MRSLFYVDNNVKQKRWHTIGEYNMFGTNCSEKRHSIVSNL